MTNLVKLEQYKVACLAYNKATELIKELTDIVLKVQPDFSMRVAHVQFDLILQTCLLSAVLEDGGFTPVKKEFVQYVPHEGDVLEVLNYYLKDAGENVKEITWDNIIGFDMDSQKRMLEDIKKVIIPMIDQFTGAFGFIDALMRNRKIYDEFREKVGAILYALHTLEGEKAIIDPNEPLPGFPLFRELTVNAWNDAMKRAYESAEAVKAGNTEPPAKA